VEQPIQGDVGRLVAALVLYAGVSTVVRRPYATPLDFRDVTAPAYLFLQVAVAVLVLAVLPPALPIVPASVAYGYVAGLAFVAAPALAAIVRREWIHQFEVRDLHSLRMVLPREALLCLVAIPAIATCEEVFFRGVLGRPEPAVMAAQWLTCRAAGVRAGPAASVCGFLAVLHYTTGSLGLVIGAHAAVQTLTGHVRSPGLFSGLYALFEQARSRSLGPTWQRAALELASGAAIVLLAR
jgi:membrane protease YdiL (CAAX protease family)